MKKIVILAALLLSLTACAEWGAIQSGAASHGAQAADEMVQTTIWTLCNAAPVGAIKRRFKTDSELAAYDSLCSE